MAKVVLGVVLGLAGISLFIVSVWLLVDTENPKVRGVHLSRGHSPKLGIAASVLLMVLGILCCCINKANLRRSLILAGVCIALCITVACFGIAVKNRLDLKEMEESGKYGNLIRRDSKFGNNGQSIPLKEFLNKLENQLVVLAVVAGLDAIVEIVSLIIAYRWKELYP